MTAISPFRRCRWFSRASADYQLYTLLNRAILFGGQHLVTVQQALDDVLMEKTR
jgi:fructosamine-3-kinase